MHKVRAKAILGVATVFAVGIMTAQANAFPIRVEPQELPVVIVAGRIVPGDLILGEPTIVVVKGHWLRLYNEDISSSHSITALDHRGGAPLFDSGIVAPGRSARIEGLNELLPGDYAFGSRTRSNMTGVLRVLDP